jgi:hypothetical protein
MTKAWRYTTWRSSRIRPGIRRPKIAAVSRVEKAAVQVVEGLLRHPDILLRTAPLKRFGKGPEDAGGKKRSPGLGIVREKIVADVSVKTSAGSGGVVPPERQDVLE